MKRVTQRSAKSPNTMRYVGRGDKSVRNMVIQVCKNHPSAKNNDRTLDRLVCEHAAELEFPDCIGDSRLKLEEAMAGMVLPSTLIIVRARRELQEEGVIKPSDREVAKARKVHKDAAPTSMPNECKSCGRLIKKPAVCGYCVTQVTTSGSRPAKVAA